jgi:seryl-tRNA(Sec) selenium transferase
MKVSKEAMVGLAVAIDQFMARDHDRDFAEHRKQADVMLAGLQERTDLRCELMADPEAHPAPIVSVYPLDGLWEPQALLHALQHGTPGIYAKVEHGGLTLNTHCLRQGEPEQIVDRINEVLDGIV